MGLFSKWKKKDEPAKNTGNPPSNCANNGKRFTFLVEDTFQLKDGKGIVVVGNVHETIAVHDAAYIMHAGNNTITLTEISGMESAEKKPVASVSDGPVALRLADIKDKKEVQKYSVLTSIRPQTQTDVNTAVENPSLLGLSMEYAKFSQDMEYLNLLVGEIVHAHFITPIYLDKEPAPNGDGSCTFHSGATMGFLSLKDPNAEGKSLFPVFTDWGALSAWKNVFDEKHPAKTMIMRFPDCVALTRKAGGGIVVNPFGPMSITLPDHLIQNIIGSERYQSEFGENAGPRVKQIKTEKDTKIMVGLPRETPEVKNIKENLVIYARAQKDIRRVDLLLKMDEKNERTYFCIVDCPKENAEKHFGSIYSAVKPYASEIPIIDFALNENADFVRDILEKNKPVYIRE